MHKSIYIFRLWPLLTLIVVGLFSILPHLQNGFIPTHDGEYHILRFWQFEKVLLSGSILPRWAPDFNSGYGVPVFIFNYPLPNYFGSFFHLLGVSYSQSFQFILAIGYVSASLFGYLWLKQLFPNYIAVCSAIVSAWIPYWFVELNVRGSVGEVLAIAFLFLALASIESRGVLLFAIAVGCIILSHNILSTVCIPFLFLYMVIRKRFLFIRWFFIGIGMSSFFWLPAVLERVNVVGLNPVNYQDYFARPDQLLIPSWGTSFFGAGFGSNEMSVQIGILPIFIIIATIISMLISKSYKRILVLFFVFVVFISIFMTLPVSGFLWRTIPLLPFWQYPWRFLFLLIPTIAFLNAFVLEELFIKKSTKYIMATFTALAAIALTYSYSRPVIYEPRDDFYYLSRSNFTDGTSSLGNFFTTIWSPAITTKAYNQVEVLEGDGKITNLQNQPLSTKFEYESSSISTIRVNTLFYPGWEVDINENKQIINYDDGLITFTAPPGRHAIRVIFTNTPIRLLSNIISLVSLFFLITFFLRRLPVVKSRFR